MNKQFLKSVIAVFIILGIGFFGVATPTYADGENDTVISKALLQGLANCYTQLLLEYEVEVSDITDATSILKSRASVRNINIPNGLVGDYAYDQISCKELVNGASTWFHGSSSSILKDKTVIPSSTSDYGTKIEFLTNMGYIPTEDSKQHCVHFKYDATTWTNAGDYSSADEATVYTPSICADVDDNGEIASELSVKDDGGSTFKFVQFKVKKDSFGNLSAIQVDCNVGFLAIDNGGCSRHVGVKRGNWNDFIQGIFDDLTTNLQTVTKSAGSAYGVTTVTYTISKATDVKSETDTTSYHLKNYPEAKKAMIEAFTGSDEIPKIDADDQARLYVTYLKKYYGAKQVCGAFTEDQKTVYEGQGYIEYRRTDLGLMCYVLATQQADKKVNGVRADGGEYQLGYQTAGFSDIVDWLKDYSGDVDVNLDTAETLDPEQSTDTATDTATSEGDPCWNAGVESQGWLLCPTLNNLKYSASALDGVVEGWLTVDTDLYDRDSAAHTVWAIMRNFANFIMIIILLVIIFSQLTGYGINNYGVKKMLPKLIVMSILINLSFVLCELAVDLSNILGVGLRNVFGAMGQGLIEASGADASNIISSIISIIFGAIGVAGAAVPAGITILTTVAPGSGVMVVIMIVMFLIVILAALILFFLALGARMIMIVLCMALSPIAFALYILPNTQQFFKKWWKIFQSALVMFPICGAISGISYLIRGMVLSNGGVHLWMLFVALVAPYLPFFLLPSLLKKAIAGLGEVGGALTTMGTRFSSGVRKGRDAVQGTSRYQEALNTAKSQHAVKRAESIQKKLGGLNRENLSRAQLDRLRKAEQVIKADTAARAAARVGSYPLEEDLAIDRAQKAREAEELKAYRDQFTGASKDELRNTAQSASTWLSQPGGAQRMSALIEAMQNNGMETDIYEMLRQNDVSSMSSVMQTLATSSNKVLKAYGKAGGGRSYTDFMQNGGLQAYAKNKGQDFVNGLDDKSLTEIASQQQQSVTGNIMGTEQLVQAAAQLNDEDSLRAINTMLGTRNDITISAEQATQLKSSTRQTLLGNTNGGRTALVNAMRAVAADPQLSGKLDNKVKADYSSAFGITFP